MLEALLLRPFADSFLLVGVPVALLAVLTGAARVRWGPKALDVLVDHPRLAVPIAAVLGLLPGCGETILVVALYLRGRASYGACVAAITATMGDAAFVLIALDPLLALGVHGVLLVAGLATGWTVDALRFDPRRARVAVAVGGGGGVTEPLVTCTPASKVAFGVAPLVLWVAAAVGLVVSVPVLLGIASTVVVGGVNLYLVVGGAGAAAAAFVFAKAGGRMCRDEDVTDLRTAMSGGAVDTAFVVVWVGVAFVLQALLVEVTGFDGSDLPLVGAVGVLVAVGVGLLPGCGVQIAFVGLYGVGALPLPALIANAVAQDGDALLPMLAEDHRTAITTTVITSVPALIAGFGALLVLS